METVVLQTNDLMTIVVEETVFLGLNAAFDTTDHTFFYKDLRMK